MEWNSPVSVLSLAPILFAVAVVIDILLVRREVYKKVEDGVVVSLGIGGIGSLALGSALGGRFGELPLDGSVFLASIGAVVLLSVHLWTYFAILLIPDEAGNPTGDGTFVETLTNANILAVPLASWVLFGDHITATQWLGISAICAGAVACRGFTQFESKTFILGMLSALSLGLMMLCQEHVYQHVNFEDGVLFFGCGLLFASAVIGFLVSPSKSLWRPSRLVIFAGSEAIGISALIASQRAIDLYPVWLVAAVEGLVPLFVLIFAGILIGVLRMVKDFLSQSTWNLMWRDAMSQWSAPRAKFAAITLMLIGTALVLHDEPEQMIVVIRTALG